MSKRIKAKYRLLKKVSNSYKNIWGNPRKDFCRSVVNDKKRKISLFGKLLIIKQSLKLFYSNINERCFKNYLNLSIRSPSKTIDKFISILERRLDVILYRSLFACSFFEARQFINHHFVFVNDVLTTCSKKRLCQGDIIYIKKLSNSLELFRFFILVKSMPNYLEVNYKCFSLVFLWDTNLINVYFPLNMKYSLISRFYR